MAETTLEKATCENCGVDVREGTQFCYNCGKTVGDTPAVSNGAEPEAISDNARAALDDLARKLDADDADIDRLAQAAAERKKARVRPKKRKEAVWEDHTERSGTLLFFIALLIFTIVAAIVLLTVYWK